MVFVDKLVLRAIFSIFCLGSLINSSKISKSVFVKSESNPGFSASKIDNTLTSFINFFASPIFCSTSSLITILQTVIPPIHGATIFGSPTRLICSNTSSTFSPDTTKYNTPFPKTGGSTLMKNFSITPFPSIFWILFLTAPPEIFNSIPICLSDSLQLFSNLLRIFISKLSIMSP